MSMVTSAPIKLQGSIQEIENACSIAIRLLMEDVHSRSNPITPKRLDPIGGTLRASVTKQMAAPMLGIMKWHAPYAEYQERGYTTGPVVHYTTPGTHAHFVEESVNDAVQQLPKFLQMGGLI